jgi:hypothetical protein
MNKSFTVVKEIKTIEEELNSLYAGVLAINTQKERLIQIPCTFLYHHKNVIAALQKDDDLYEKIIFDTEASFTIIREKINKKPDAGIHYKITSVTLNGMLKRPEEIKISDEIKELYSLKYSGTKDIDEDSLPVQFLMLDTVEIKALQEVGG